jgi:hypothetical protein
VTFTPTQALTASTAYTTVQNVRDAAGIPMTQASPAASRPARRRTTPPRRRD